MIVKKIVIENFKCFNKKFTLELNKGINILVGDNESGKSTILEAMNLALTGFYNGRYFKNELTQYFFNCDVVKEYISKIKNGESIFPPHILIEIFFESNNLPNFEGNGNSEKCKGCGIKFEVKFDEKYKKEYEAIIKSKNIETLPIEYYDISWQSFARESITPRNIPLKASMIDSSSSIYKNGFDIYISRMIKENLEPNEIVEISQAYRKMREAFMCNQAIKDINKKIISTSKISNKKIKISVELLSKNAWEGSMVTYLDEIPFNFIGKGGQSVVKTKLALAHKKVQEANLILIEEPENHLTHTRLNQLISDIKNDIGEKNNEKQIVISTHSSFVANKLGLGNLILLNNGFHTRFNELKPDTKHFFEKVAGYDTLRLILCHKAILVEGDSDELIVQKAYKVHNNGSLPIEKGIDVISVGTSFLRFLEIAEKIEKPVAVVTDNDGDIESLREKYREYIDDDKKDYIKIFFDDIVDTGHLENSEASFNYNTLEPKLLKVNNVEKFNKIFETSFNKEGLLRYMKNNKTECALKIFRSDENINFPNYIEEAIKFYEK